MKKLIRSAAAVLCAAGVALTVAACGNDDEKTEKPDNDNEITTPVKPEKIKYAVIENGNANAEIISGTAENNGDSVSFDSAVLTLDKPVILPFGDKAEWEIRIKGTLMPDGTGGGQFLNSSADETDGRVYFGVNGNNNVMFIGVCVGDTYANYCWDVPLSTMSGEHGYEIKYSAGEYALKIDGGDSKYFESININQADRTKAESKKASSELTDKICAVTGQNFLRLSDIGSHSHPCTNVFSDISVETTSKKGYKDLYSHPLSDRYIAYLGSSVTRGHGGNTDGTSFADMTAHLTGGSYKKEAISGTNLAITGGRNDSYAERIEKLNLANNQPDVLVVQLSTNDFSNSVPLGSVSDGTAAEEFDKKTVTGAIEYIIARTAELSPETKIVVYTCPLNSGWGKYAEYGNYIDGNLKELEQKWVEKLYVLDLYNADYIKVSSYIQGDNLHPQKEGYAQVFTPLFLNLLQKIL